MSFLKTLNHVKQQACDALTLAAIRESGAWWHWDDQRQVWCVFKHVNGLVPTSEGATPEEALKGLEGRG
jgi:hypothetical protein